MFSVVELVQDLFNQQLPNQHILVQLFLIALVANGIFFSTCLTLFSGYHILQVIRLYIIAQFSCAKVDYVKRYGKWALVTGATDGIGLAMAKELARRGHSIIIVGRNEEKLASCKKLIENENDAEQIEVLTVKIDLSDPCEQNYAIVKAQIDPDSRDIGILINNAGLAPSGKKLFHESEAEQFFKIANVNMLATLHFTRMILPGMICRGRGCVVNISSILGRVLSPYGNIYGPSKAFINRFTSNLRLEYSDYPIDFMAVTPSNVQTKLLQQMDPNKFMVKESFVGPSAETFARSVINAISTRISPFTGCLGHAITLPFLKVVQFVGFYKLLAKFAFNIRVPSYKARRKPQRQSEIDIELMK